MKQQRFYFILFLIFTLLLTSGCIKELHYHLTIGSNGSGSLSQHIFLHRAMVEQSLARRHQEEYVEPGGQTPAFSDEELESTIRTSFEAKSRDTLGDSELDSRIESMEIGPEIIELKITSSAPDLATLVEHTHFIWEELENPLMTVGKTTKKQLEISLTSRVEQDYVQQWMEYYSNMFSSMHITFSMTVEMPGTIIFSNFGSMDGNISALTISSWDEDSIARFHKLLGEGVHVVSETGGLKLPDTHLNSDELLKMARNEQQKEFEKSLPPITEAGPGYLPVALNSQTSRTRHFPEAEKIFGDTILARLPDKEITKIQGRLFLPRNRLLHSTGELHLISATDDQGREISTPRGAMDENAQATFIENYRDTGTDVDYCNFSLQLNAPPKDCRAIGVIRLEGIITTFSGWKKQEIPELENKKDQPVDLSNLLPGTTLTLREIKKSSQMNEYPRFDMVELELTGPPELARLDHQIGREREANFFQEEVNRTSKTVDGVMTQKIILPYQSESSEENGEDEITLTVRLPMDMKREKLVFELRDLDLY